MSNYTDIITRTSGGPDALVPEPLATAIIEEAPKSSAALSLMNKTLLSSKTQRLPVLDVLPIAYWVGGDTGLKQTSKMMWQNVVLVVEELACIVPIPENYIDDADVPLWSQVQPRMSEAVGALIDSAVLWGVNKPSTWGQDVYGGAALSGQAIVEGTTPASLGTGSSTDYGQDVSNLGQIMAATGYTVNGFAGMPGMNWKLIGLRSVQGVPIYEPDMQGGQGGNLYGFPISMVQNGSWAPATATLLAGDFDKTLIGIRRDITFKMFDQGVISDATGKVILNLMQQDAVAMRMTMRLAYATVNPVTIMQRGKTISQRWPFGAILPRGTTLPGTGAISQMTSYSAAGAYQAWEPPGAEEQQGQLTAVYGEEGAAQRPDLEDQAKELEEARHREEQGSPAVQQAQEARTATRSGKSTPAKDK